MDVSRFVRGLSAPPSIGAHPPAPATVANAGKSSAPAEVRVGPLNQRNHPYMFLRPLSHLIWPGNGNNHINSNNNTRKEKKFQEGLESLEAATLIKEDEEEEMKLTRVLKGLGVERENLLERHAAEPEESTSDQEKDEGWVMKILRVRSIWEDEGAHRTAESEPSEESNDVAEDQDVGCAVDDDDVEEIVFDRDSFGRLLKKVSLDEAKVYAKMSYLCNLAYCIQRIKPQNLLKFHRLKFITSSVNTKTPVNKPNPKPDDKPNLKSDNKPVNKITASSAYNSVASAASYLQSNSDWTPPVRGRTGEDSIEETTSSVTDSVTAVVSANEETKEEIVKDLNFGKNSPCEWFVCDDEEKGTRFFVIQGSESLPSWQANLLFEPVQFEGTDILVHRGIYEAAKGIFSQMLPFITASSSPTSSAKPKNLQFTGHSLGGSLSLLISLMLVTRGVVPASRLLPAVTFGAPAVMCGGDYLLAKLGLGKNHLHAITMHRDIVPRAFACNYPDNVARILKAVNGKFRDHPCLTNQKLLYAPMGKLVILQPDEKHSPPHHLLPPGCGLYLFNGLNKPDSPFGLLKAAQSAFINSPHPLEILSDRSAYGPEGTVFRDHDMNSYLKSLKSVIRQEVKLLRKNKKQSQHVWRPLVVPSGVDPCVIMGPRGSTLTKVDFSGLFRGGRENFRRFKRLVASRHVHLLVLVFLPARLLILGLFNPLLA